jgi:Arc/MetJ-type ribon-helix-helix transcriptional regulator
VKQFTLNVTPEFERDLSRYMRERKISTKSEAVRRAVREALDEPVSQKSQDFRDLLGIGVQSPESKNRRFRSTNELW